MWFSWCFLEFWVLLVDGGWFNGLGFCGYGLVVVLLGWFVLGWLFVILLVGLLCWSWLVCWLLVNWLGLGWLLFLFSGDRCLLVVWWFVVVMLFLYWKEIFGCWVVRGNCNVWIDVLVFDISCCDLVRCDRFWWCWGWVWILFFIVFLVWVGCVVWDWCKVC